MPTGESGSLNGSWGARQSFSFAGASPRSGRFACWIQPANSNAPLRSTSQIEYYDVSSGNALDRLIANTMGFGIAHATHYGRADNPTVAASSKLPVWLLVLIVFRAGIVEELFYREYAIERIESLGLNRFRAVVIPLTMFGVAHWTGDWANILIALALGVILSVFYVWRRDLVANMIAYFLVDFIGNIH